VRKERNLYGPGVVHDDGVPHGRSEDPLVRAPVLLRHDLSQRVVLRTKLETHI
jgi:hypothetical protein